MAEPCRLRIAEIQAALVEGEIDGWLFAVFQGNDPISLDLLGIAGRALVTRRCYYLVPSQGATAQACLYARAGDARSPAG